MEGLVLYQDPINWAIELYYDGKRLPVRVDSLCEPDEQSNEVKITISTVRGYPITISDTRPERNENGN